LQRIDDVTTVVGEKLPGARRTLAPLVASTIAPGAILEGPGGYAIAVELSERVEQELETHLSNRKGLPLFGGTRQLSQRLWAHLGAEGLQIAQSRRSICELALHKYARWPQRDVRAALPVWNESTINPLVRLLALSELYGDCLAARRRLAKGEVNEATGIPGNWIRPASPDSDSNELIQRRDERAARNDNVFSEWATLEPATWSEGAERVLAAELADPVSIGLEYEKFDSQFPRAPVEIRVVAANMFEHVTTTGFLHDLTETRRQLEFHDTVLRATRGVSLAGMEVALELATTRVLESNPNEELDEMARHGYFFAPALTDKDVRDAYRARSTRQGSAWDATNPDEVIQSLQYLDASHQNSSLDNPVASRPIRTIGERMLYDALHARIPNALLWDLDLSQDLQKKVSTRFEHDVHRRLGRFGDQPWNAAHELRSGGTTITDVDASVIIDGGTLVVVDCYSSPWSPALDQGSHSATRNREERLRLKKVPEWERKWETIRGKHPNLLPDRVQRVVPVVVTAGVEWIASLDPAIWFNNAVPKACTIGELEKLLESGSFDPIG